MAFADFVAIVKALRTPGTGCPWDLEQDHRSLRRYLIEETYEVLDAIDRANDADLREELGDLLLQVVLHAQLAADRGAFAIDHVVADISAKMIRRHPHVFGGASAQDSAEVLRNWDAIKAREKPRSIEQTVAALPKDLPALVRAQRVLEKRKAESASDETLWVSLDDFLATSSEASLGTLLLDICRRARAAGLDAESALRERTSR